MERRVRLETDDIATIAQVKKRAFAGANRTALQTILVEIDWAEVLAVAAILPLEFHRGYRLAFEIDLSEQVTAILTLDRTLSRSEESSFVFGAEYSHFRCSLQRQVTVQVVIGTKHDMVVGGSRLKDENIRREVCVCA